MGDDIVVVADEPLVDGMTISVRYRRDFIVTDATGLLDTARRMFRELEPHESPERTAALVTCAADAIFTILEHDGLLGDAIEARLASHEPDGLTALGWRAQAVINEPDPLPTRPDCFRTGDVYALPTTALDDDTTRHLDDR